MGKEGLRQKHLVSWIVFVVMYLNLCSVSKLQGPRLTTSIPQR